MRSTANEGTAMNLMPSGSPAPFSPARGSAVDRATAAPGASASQTTATEPGFGQTLHDAAAELSPCAEDALSMAASGDQPPADSGGQENLPAMAQLTGLLQQPGTMPIPMPTPTPEGEGALATDPPTATRPVAPNVLMQGTQPWLQTATPIPGRSSAHDGTASQTAGLTASPASVQGKTTDSIAGTAPVDEQAPSPAVPPGAAAPSPGSFPHTLSRMLGPASGPLGTLTLPAPPAAWREPLLSALEGHVQWQLQRGLDQAVVRLAPPQMGRIDIVIRQDAAGLMVQLQATHRDVAQQLHAVSDALRQDLGQRQAMPVSVQVADAARPDGWSAGTQTGEGGRGERQRDGQDEEPPTRALQDAEAASPRAGFALPLDLT